MQETGAKRLTGSEKISTLSVPGVKSAVLPWGAKMTSTPKEITQLLIAWNLERIDPQQGQIVELRYFSGLTIEEIAEVIGVSPATVKREWSAARAWLRRELSR